MIHIHEKYGKEYDIEEFRLMYWKYMSNAFWNNTENIYNEIQENNINVDLNEDNKN